MSIDTSMLESTVQSLTEQLRMAAAERVTLAVAQMAATMWAGVESNPRRAGEHWTPDATAREAWELYHAIQHYAPGSTWPLAPAQLDTLAARVAETESEGLAERWRAARAEREAAVAAAAARRERIANGTATDDDFTEEYA